MIRIRFNAYSDDYGARENFLKGCRDNAKSKVRNYARDDFQIFESLAYDITWCQCDDGDVDDAGNDASRFAQSRPFFFATPVSRVPRIRDRVTGFRRYWSGFTPHSTASPAPLHTTLCTFSPPPHTMNCVCIQAYRTPPCCIMASWSNNKRRPNPAYVLRF